MVEGPDGALIKGQVVRIYHLSIRLAWGLQLAMGQEDTTAPVPGVGISSRETSASGHDSLL